MNNNNNYLDLSFSMSMCYYFSWKVLFGTNQSFAMEVIALDIFQTGVTSVRWPKGFTKTG